MSHKLTITEMQKAAYRKGGKCLSKKYINAHTKLKWKCQKGHVWKAIPDSIKRGSWCPACGELKNAKSRRKHSIKDAKEHAKNRKGRCLSSEYTGVDSKLKWKCKDGHTWEASFYSVVQLNSWCPYCSGRLGASIKDFSKIAKKRGGKCLSKKYLNSRYKLKFECSEGHIWRATPSSVKGSKNRPGRWCPICGTKNMADKQRDTIENMQRIAKERMGQCLTETYVNNSTKLRWQCRKGHAWEAVPGSIKAGRWCPICAVKIRADALKSGIEYYKTLARRKGGECLSNDYINNQTKLRWKCKESHTWEATPASIKGCKNKKPSWCPVCSGIKRYTIKDMKALAKKRGGNCLSSEYINSTSKLRWKCKEGHTWEATPGSVYYLNTWCPYCSGRLGNTIEQFKTIAKKRNGKCLSNRYVNSKVKLKFQCREGHVWEAVPHSIKNGSWCPICASKNRSICKKLNIDDMHRLAIEKGGSCLSSEYRNSNSKLRWQCKDGHVWKATPSKIKNSGQWCPFCIGRHKTIKDMQKVAKERGGRCLSRKFKGVNNKLKWECQLGHIWEAVPSSILTGRWCPDCAKGVGERICRAYFEQLFGESFPSKRDIKWLVNEKGNCLELDGYCAKLRIAFEHQGEQHYSDRSPYQRTRTDQLKRNLCKKHKVKLIEIEQVNDKVMVSELREYIKQKLKEARIVIPRNFNKIQIDLSNVYSPSWLDHLKAIARNRGGKCLSKQFLGNNVKVKWQCKRGHIWEAVPNSIKGGTWCPHCAGRVKYLSDMIKLAQKRGGKCLSKTYRGARAKLKWQCKYGHTWETAPMNIVKGSWCPECANKRVSTARKLTIDEMQKIARERGGKCLSKEYLGAQAKLSWQCKKGHIWEATPGGVRGSANRKGRWCPICGRNGMTISEIKRFAVKKGFRCLSNKYLSSEAKLKWKCNKGHIWETELRKFKKRKTCPVCLEEMKKKEILSELKTIAKEYKGTLLSKSFTNYSTKMEWQCSKGHKWRAIPNNVKKGHWCPYCAGVLKLTIREMQKIAKERGGNCLSKKYINANTKLKWQCSDGHIWEATPGSVKSQGTWCPKCAPKKSNEYKKLSIEEMQNLAKAHGGKCLSKEYTNNTSKLKWQCREGHVWEAIPTSVKRGSWCKLCGFKASGDKKRLNIEIFNKIAKERGGKCLSKEYINTRTKLKWQCKKSTHGMPLPVV